MDRAGAETLIMNIYRSIDRSRMQFDFLCVLPRKGDYDGEIASLGGRVFHLPQPDSLLSSLSYFGKIFSYRSFFRDHPEYHTVHFHNSHALSVAIQLSGASLGRVSHKIVHSHNSNAPYAVIHRMFKPLIGLFGIHRMACSAEAARWMFGREGRNALVVKNGICLREFAFSPSERERLRKELGLEEKKIILHIGRFTPQKNHAYILRIFKEIAHKEPSAHLLLVGAGELFEEVRSSIAASGLSERVTMLGRREDIPELLSAADLFLFPSLYEGLSVALVEAQADGLPVLTTTNLSPETIFSSSLLQLSTSEEPGLWADEALRLIAECQHSDRTAEAASAGFDITRVASSLTRYYEQLLPQHP